jgi:hypothetical protein
MTERMANLMIPVSTDREAVSTAHILISMTETHARAVVNMDPNLAQSYGDFFVAIKNALTVFIEQEG